MAKYRNLSDLAFMFAGTSGQIGVVAGFCAIEFPPLPTEQLSALYKAVAQTKQSISVIVSKERVICKY